MPNEFINKRIPYAVEQAIRNQNKVRGKRGLPSLVVVRKHCIKCTTEYWVIDEDRIAYLRYICKRCKKQQTRRVDNVQGA